jgi:hypothetical protein
MAVAQLRGESSVQEPIVKEILSLTEKALSRGDHDRMTTIFTDNTKNIQFILSNSEEYEKVGVPLLPQPSLPGERPLRKDRGLHAESAADRRGENATQETFHR